MEVIEMRSELLTRIETLVELLGELSRHSEELVYVVNMNNKVLQKLISQVKGEALSGLTP